MGEPRGRLEAVRSYTFDLRILASDWLSVYRGRTRAVLVETHCGERVQFSAQHLRPFVTANGVFGRFRLTTDAQSRFVRLERVTATRRGGQGGSIVA